MFWTYQMHLHNLAIEGLDAVMPNPHVDFRWSQIKIQKVDFKTLEMVIDKSKMEEITNQVSAIKLSAHSCPLCETSAVSEEELMKHMKKEHPETHSSNPRECPECNKVLSSAQALNRHVKTIHRTCSVRECKLEFESAEAMIEHKKVHTICHICGKDWVFPSKLKLHMKSHK